MPFDPLDLAATPERLHALARAGVLTPAALGEASQRSVATPGADAWRRFLSTGLLGFGSLLVLSGVIYFFAYNWEALHRFGKLGLVLAAITGACVAAWRLGDTLSGQFSLLFAAVLVGPLLAIYGQAYQTGADPYGLFLGWGVLILPWVALARFGPLWLLWLVLGNTALGLFWDQTYRKDEHLFLALGVLNGVAWALHEGLARRRVAWLQVRWLPRVLAVMSVMPLLGVAVGAAFERSDAKPEHVIALGLLGGVMAAVYGFHRKVRPELFLLSLVAFAAIFWITCWLGSLLFDVTDSIVAFFMTGLLIIGQVGLAVGWLRSEARDAEEI